MPARPGVLLALPILLAAFALRLVNLTFQPLWFDEGWSVWFTTADLPVMAARTAADIHPPFYYALLHYWTALAGISEFTLRFLSVMVGLAGVAVMYRLAGELAGPRAAALAALLAAISPLHVFYSQEIRMYGLVTALGALSSLLFWRLVQEGNPGQGRRALAYVLVTGAAMYTQYYAAFIPLAHFVFWALTGRGRLRDANPTILLSFLALFVLYLPWLLYAGGQLNQYVAGKVIVEEYVPLAPLDYAVRHAAAFAAGHPPPDLAWLGWSAALFALLAALGLIPRGDVTPQGGALARSLRSTARRDEPQVLSSGAPGTRDGQDRSPALFLLLYLLVPVCAAYLVQLRFPFSPPRMERLLLLALPPFLILAARGLAGCNFRSLNLQSAILRLRSGQVCNLQLAVLLLISALPLLSFYTQPRYPEQDYRALAGRIDALALPGEAVMLVHPWQVGFLQVYLRTPVSLQPVASPEWGQAVEAQLSGHLAAGRRIWLPAYQALGRILETAMEKHLGQNALLVDRQWYEKTLLSFYAPAPQWTELPSGIQFGDLRLAGLGSEFAPRAAGRSIIPLKWTWQSPRALERLPRVSVRLRDTHGRLWAAQDRDLDARRQEGAGTAYLYSSQIGFLVPAGTPPGTYRLSLAVYEAAGEQVAGLESSIGFVEVVRPETPPPVEALFMQTRRPAAWPDLRLLGFSARDGPIKTGEWLHADLFWQARVNVSEDYVIFVQLQDSGGKVYVLSEGLPPYPTSRWRAGDLMREQRDLLLPAALAPGQYRLVAGLLRARDRERLPLAGGGDQAVLREVVVAARPHQFMLPTAQINLDVRLGDLARIAGGDFGYQTQTRTVRVRLYWQALREVDTSYSVFVHVIAPDGKTLVAQHDGPPGGGATPTTAWLAGEYVADEHVIRLSPNVPPGLYRVRAGLYDPQTGIRLNAFAQDGREYPDGAAELWQFEVK